MRLVEVLQVLGEQGFWASLPGNVRRMCRTKGRGNGWGFGIKDSAERRQGHKKPWIGFGKRINGQQNGSDVERAEWKVLKCRWVALVRCEEFFMVSYRLN